MAVGSALPLQRWLPTVFHGETQAERDANAIVQRSDSHNDRHAVDVLYTIDGDTFGARVHLAPGEDLTAHIRLRGIDAPELKGRCTTEIRLAEDATAALKRLLKEGGVMIYNIGSDKYPGRVVADVATRRTPNVSAALLSGGFARRYDGGHRDGWCDK